MSFAIVLRLVSSKELRIYLKVEKTAFVDGIYGGYEKKRDEIGQVRARTQNE